MNNKNNGFYTILRRIKYKNQALRPARNIKITTRRDLRKIAKEDLDKYSIPKIIEGSLERRQDCV